MSRRALSLILLCTIVALMAALLLSGPAARGAHVNPAVVATAPVGASPHGVGVNATTNRVYVANRGSNTISVIDGATDAVVATVPVGSGPLGVGVNAATNRVYVANHASNTVSVIDGASNAVVATVPVGTTPFGVGVNAATDRVYVANFHSDTVSVIADGVPLTPTPTPTETPTPTPGMAVGGIAELPDVAQRPLETPSSSGGNYGLLWEVVAAVTFGLLGLGGAAWYTRKRGLR